jgi:DNA-binding response OmpR family regulator
MRHPQLLVYEFDGRLAALLRSLAEVNRWSLREPRQIDECLRLLERGGPAVVVLRAGRDLELEFGLLEQVRWRHPDVPVVVVADSEHVRLVGLAWDLGAAYVHLPPAPRENLPAVVAGLMGVGFLGEPL